MLDSIVDADPEAQVRVLLERGRLLNSSGSPLLGIPVFAEASAIAWDSGLEFLAIDAMHMEAIVAPAEMQDALNGKALEFAERASDPRARRWRGSLLNNMGWTAFERGDLDAALGRFKAALAARLETGRQSEIDVARWCIARTLRATGQLDEALEIQQALAAEHAAAGTADPFVQEELAELESALKSAT